MIIEIKRGSNFLEKKLNKYKFFSKIIMLVKIVNNNTNKILEHNLH